MRHIGVSFFVTALAAGIVASSMRADPFVCQQATCITHIVEGPVIKKVVLNRGDVVDTDDGWIVNEGNGWEPLQ
jgi:hypothetical protein